MATQSSSGPLAGVRVVELSSFVSGPFATLMLADLGADVIKVESERGDPLRRFGRSGRAVSPLFANCNRGKRSVVLDLKSEEGRTALHGLLADADVLVTNWRPGVAQRLGIDDDAIARRNPALVRVYVTGFGPDGPLADVPTYDSLVQAHIGAAEGVTGEARPPIAGSYVVDKTAATMVCQATLAALVARSRLGVGDRVDVSLLDAAAYVSFPDVFANRTFVDDESGEARNAHAAATRALQAEDGWLVVAPVTASQVRRACEVIGRPELADELLALTDATALTTRLLDSLEDATRRGPVERWVRAFNAADVPAGPCLSLDEHLADAQVQHNGLYEVVDLAGVGRVRQIRYPAVFSTWGRLRAATAPPAPGEHGGEILGALEVPV